LTKPNINRRIFTRSLLGIAGFTAIAGNKVIAQTTTQPIKGTKNMNTNPVMVTVKLVAKEKDTTIAHLSRALPTTRNYQGCRYCNTYIQQDKPQEIVLIQGWDSRQAQQNYIQWRKETGALDELLALLTEPPVVEFWNLNQA
jgi:quinol monooxygenase YgiN